MKYLLDTCVISELVKPVPNINVVNWLKNTSPEVLFLSVITVGEITKGLVMLPDSKRKERLTHWLDTLVKEYQDRLFPIDLFVMENWGLIQGNAEEIGAQMPSMDSLIAAIAYSHNLILVTRNEGGFSSGQIPMFNPWKL